MHVTFQDVLSFVGPALLGLVSLLLSMVLARLKANEDTVKELGKTVDTFIKECIAKDAKFVDDEQCRKFHDRCRDALFNEFRSQHKRDVDQLWYAIKHHHHTRPDNITEDRVIMNGAGYDNSH